MMSSGTGRGGGVTRWIDRRLLAGSSILACGEYQR